MLSSTVSVNKLFQKRYHGLKNLSQTRNCGQKGDLTDQRNARTSYDRVELTNTMLKLQKLLHTIIILRDTEYLVNEAILDYQGAISEYQSAQKREQSMELAFEVVQKKREKGMISIMEFYQAKNNLATARGQSLRTKLQLFLSERKILLQHNHGT